MVEWTNTQNCKFCASATAVRIRPVQQLSCDIHHIIEKSKGGSNDISNLIVVCPNHHRIIHTNKCYSIEYLKKLSIKNTFNNWKDYYHPER